MTTRRGRPKGPPITPRMRDVIALVAEGLDNAEIGTQLRIKPAYVQVLLSVVYERLGFRDRGSSRVRVALYAFRNGIATIPQNEETNEKV